jgi:hypothetical protein
MVKLFRQYYECMNSNAGYEKKSDETKANWGAFAGISFTSMKFVAEEGSFNEIVNSDFPVSANVAFGVFLNKKFSRNLGRFSLHNELLFSSFRADAIYREISSENQYVNNSITLGGSFIKLNNMFQYSYPVKGVSLMVRLGISNGLNVHETNQNIVESVFYTTKTTVTNPAIDGTKKYIFGILGGIGAGYKRFSLDIRYEQNSGMSDMPTLRSSVRTMYFLLGYRF